MAFLQRRVAQVDNFFSMLLHSKVLDYVKKKPAFVENIVRNSGHAGTLDLLIKIIQCEESEEGAGIVQVNTNSWLNVIYVVAL